MMDSSKQSSTRLLDSAHSCRLCPLIELEVGVQLTIALPFEKVFFSAIDGCHFLNERLKRMLPPSLSPSWMYQDKHNQLSDRLDFFSILCSTLNITTSISDGCCIVDCGWRRPDGLCIEYFEDGLLAYTTKRDGLATHYIKTRPPNEYPVSPENIEWMRHCMHRCHGKHAKCNKLRQEIQSFKLPKYLLDLGFSGGTQVQMKETQAIQGSNIKYAGLTYCWGEDPVKLKTSKTISKNLQHRLDGFSLSELPKTIQDAAEVTRALGLRYLWVDALCIPQDQDEQVIERNLDAMPEFYARAAVVISAARAAHSEAGLVERAFEEKREPIDTRAWTQQEHKNALCILRFESGRVLWECQEEKCADSDIADHRPLHLVNWAKEVTKFSARRARTLDEKLAAFEKTSKNLAEIMSWDPSQYKAGLWMKDMPRGLLWYRDSHLENDPIAGIPARVTSTPSWSWASIQSPITWEDNYPTKWNDYTLEVIECTVKLKSCLHPFKNVEKGQLVVKGYVRKAFWNGGEIVEGRSHGEANRTSNTASETGTRNRSRSPLKPHKAGDQYYRSRSPVGSDRHVHYGWHISAELPMIPIEVVWDTPVEPVPQMVRCLEVRSAVKTVGRSYGIVLSYNGSNTSKRLGFFRFQHRVPNAPETGRPEEIDPNWLHQKRRRRICII
ncbi:HET-domain-containing protein [Thozetella sp. PMI_491]|nr:HET-domain-containing protein [Thozetella sp. PMI_491]